MIAALLNIVGRAYRFATTVPTNGYALTYDTATNSITPSARRDHVYIPIYASAGTNLVISNIGAGPSGISANVLVAVDLRRAARFRIQAVVNVGAVDGGTLRLQYSTDKSVWVDAEASGTGADISIVTPAHVIGAWGTLAAGAKIETCYLRLAGYGGDGEDDPGFRMLAVETEES